MTSATVAPTNLAIPVVRPALFRAVAVAVLAGLAVLGAGGRSDAATSTWSSPVEPLVVVRGFEPPAGPYAPGHRGVDLAGVAGQSIRAAGDGVVSFSGQVGGVGALAVVHGRIRTTYQPVSARLPVGTAVAGGDSIGLLAPVGSHCAPEPCLHWGALAGDVYLDPLTLLDPAPSRLLPYWEDNQRAGARLGAAGVRSRSHAELSAARVPALVRSESDQLVRGLPPAGQVLAGPQDPADQEPIASRPGVRQSLPPGIAAAAAVIGGVGVGAAFLVIRRRRG